MDGHQLTAKTALPHSVRRAVKCTTKVSQAVSLIYGHIHSLWPTEGSAGEHVGYVVRFRHQVLRQQKYNMRQ